MNTDRKLQRHLSPAGTWAFAIGTSVGWGSLVVTANTYLSQAGPMGSVLGLVLGALIMLVISRNYAYMMRCYPESGGAYNYTSEVFGHDYGFLTAWFLAMTYLAILWANTTSLPLFGRIFLGGIFRFGRLYTLFGYDVYLGEALLSIAALLLFGYVCTRQKIADGLMIALASLFTVGIAACFIGSAVGGAPAAEPAFVPDSSAIRQIKRIAVISPWAFIGFENISHAAEEFKFGHEKIHRILVIAVVSTLALYILVTLLSVSAFPARYDSWLSYIRDIDNLSGLEALPAFYAADHYMGGFGVLLLMLSLLALVITSLIGNTMALSRLFYRMAKDEILPHRFSTLDDAGVPKQAVALVIGASVLIPFVGRTAIGWIVDVTTIGATLIYGLVSAAAMVMAKNMGDRHEMWTGRIGVAAMTLFGAYILLPNLLARGSMAKETYFLFIVWSMLGFLFFRNVLQRDKNKRFGNSFVVWLALLALVLMVALIWMRQSMIDSNDQMLRNIRGYYADMIDLSRMNDEHYIEAQMDWLTRQDTRTMLMACFMFAFAIIIMITNHNYMSRRTRESEMLANRDPMTGVKSKTAYMNKVQEIDAAIAQSVQGDFAVVVCDVNGLKKINDTYGHKAGDEYICKSCKMVCDIFQHSPVFRVGGDEFVSILTGRDFAIRRELMTVLHDRSAGNIADEGPVVSGGMADFIEGQDADFHMVFERADAGMYKEKQLLKGLGAASRDEEKELSDAAALFPAAGSSQPPIFNVRKKILVVEDEAVNQMLLGNVLKEDYDVIFASDGVEALEQLRDGENDVALVLLDLLMPRMNGMDVLKAMRDDAALKDIPVIVFTSDQKAELDCLRLGALDFIPKPYPAWEILLARVHRCVELSENRDTIQSTERDSLTKLYNLEYFARYVNMYDRHYWDMAMDAVVVDVNHFHMINERYGKHYGDSVLKRVADKLRQIAREIGGVGCRQGADTFLLYCPHREDYTELLERVSAGLTVGGDAAGNRIRLRVGVYANVDKNLDIERRFDRAKMAADNVKNSRVKPIGIYTAEMHEQALYRERLLEDFRASLEQRRFTVFFQPKFDIRPETPILASAEALVRWKHPELGMISPAVFIPLLEESGLILELDRFVWHETAAQIRAWKDRYGFSVPVSVNVSRIDMLSPNLKGIFMDILAEYRLSADDIILEITESAYTEDAEQVISTARELRGMGMGFRIEMDDFGTGYSSLGMLTHLPIDALKLDMTFVRNAFGETRDVRMIELIIDIADYLHVPVVAEGVETEEQLLVLKAMGCDLVQGYYFSKPVPKEEFDRFLIERGSRGVEVSESLKKTAMSISRAMNSDFESMYYVDIMTDYYLEFYTGPDGELKIRPGGTDFFTDAPAKLLKDVLPEDAGDVRAALQKANIQSWLGREESVTLSFKRMIDGEVRPYRLQTIRTRNSDDHHVVIGIRPE